MREKIPKLTQINNYAKLHLDFFVIFRSLNTKKKKKKNYNFEMF